MTVSPHLSCGMPTDRDFDHAGVREDAISTSIDETFYRPR